MLSSIPTDTSELATRLQGVADQAVQGRGVHGLTLAVQSADGRTTSKVAAGDARPSTPAG